MKKIFQYITFERILLSLLTIAVWIIVLQNAGVLKHQVIVKSGAVAVIGGSMEVDVQNTVSVDVDNTVPVEIKDVDPLSGPLPVEIQR